MQEGERDGSKLRFACVYLEAKIHNHTVGKAAFLQGLHLPEVGIAWTCRFPLLLWSMRKIKYSQSADPWGILAVRVSAEAQRLKNKG